MTVSADVFWKIIVPLIVILCLLGSGIGILIVDKIIMPGIVHNDRGTVTIPSITRQPWEKARQSLFDVGLRLQIKERKYDEKIPRDFIISQEPAPDDAVKKGRMVVVVVSKGSETGTVPDVRNLPERKAITELRRQGFLVGKKRHDYSDELGKNQVVSVSPAPGTGVSREMPLDLLISDGPRPTHADMPNLIGESLLDAKLKIEKGGLKLGRIEYKNSATLSPGTVISQSLPPGSSVALQSTIDLVVSVVN
jgi:eukaryotic-like serine/threonine-protein kinase